MRGKLVLACLGSVVVLGQPRPAYLIPDVGAPGMAVYVEIVARQDAWGSFGADGVYANRVGDSVRVECVRPEDTARITVGPLVVSWGGRLVSTVIFVHPWVRPNSWRWSELLPEFRIPLRITVGGQSAVVDTFYVVQPTPIGAYTGSGRVLGEGELGVRSRRGALVVDSLILPAGVSLRVSTADCDPWTPGNQGYLPCVLMAVGPIRGGAGARISVGAEGINAGPGGGGGGGSFCDVLLGSARGSDGGNGFTSGGRGGKNGIGVGPNEYRNYGQSTGPNGESLNGVGPGTSPQYESAGGGTGHPFGRSGEGCRDGYSCMPEGGYGGGSGFQQGQAGGAGGYGTAGASSGGSNGGREHGNACLVPLAGGSGGASGNPQGVNVCSGAGGGGGGALRVVAPWIEGVQFTAEGAPGGVPSSGAAGGSGSGGAVHICAALGYALPPVIVAGGQAAGSPSGGAGRVRFDGEEVGATSVQPPQATRYTGPSIAPTPPVPRQRAVVRGTGNGQDIVLYMKSASTPWSAVDTLVGYGTRWSTQLLLPEPDTLFFLVALQRVPTPSVAPYGMEPAWVLSPAAALLVEVAHLPRLEAPAERRLDTLLCAGSELSDTLVLRNTGDGVLRIDTAFFARGTQGFSLVAPGFPQYVAPGDSLLLRVRFRAPAVPGTFRDTLVVVHNDTLTAGSPWRIAYSGVKDTVAFVLAVGGSAVDTLDFGSLCPGEERVERVVVRNMSGRSLHFAAPRVTNAAQWDVAPQVPFTLAAGEEYVLLVRCRSGMVGQTQGTLLVQSLECARTDTLSLRVRGLQTRLVWRGSGQFGFVRVGTASELSVALRNEGYSPAWIPAAPNIGAPFQIVSITPPPPLLLLPQQEAVFRLRYRPTAPQEDAAELVVVAVRADSACPDTARLLLAGTGVQVALRTDPGVLDFGMVSRCEAPLDTVWLVNVGTVPVEVVRPAQVVGPEAGDFVVVVQPAVPFRLAPGDSARYIVQLIPVAATGVRSAQLVVAIQDTEEFLVTVPMRAERVSAFVAVPAAVDMGTLRRGQLAQTTLVGRNLLLRPLTVQAVRSLHPEVSVSPQTVTIPASGRQDFTIVVAPQRLGLLEAELLFIVSEPCVDTHRVVVRASVTGDGVAYTSVVDFGTVAFCQERFDTVVVTNQAADTLWIEAATLVGPDAAVFGIMLPPLPVGIVPGESARYPVFFRPAGTPDGVKSARLRLEARLGAEPLSLDVLLSGRRQTPLLSAPPQVDFGSVVLGRVAQQPLGVSNRGTEAIGIDSFRLERGAAFSVVAAPPLPRVVAPTESLTFLVQFQPVQAGLVLDTLRLFLSQPCRDERAIVLTGIGVMPSQVRVWFPDTQASPWERGFRIPLRYAFQSAGIGSPVRWAEMEVAYESSLFLLRGVSRGVILQQQEVAGMARVRLRVEALPVAESGVITELIGDVLLGSAEETPLQIVSFLWDDGIVSSQTERRDGRLRLTGLCTEGGPRLLRPAGAVRLSASAAEGWLQVMTEAGERGVYAVELYSLEGQRLQVVQWREEEAGVHRRQWTFRAPAPGVYAVVFRTPTEVRSTLVLVLR